MNSKIKYYVEKMKRNIATINIFDSVVEEIRRYKYTNIYTSEMHAILKIRAGHCIYAEKTNRNIDEYSFDRIICCIQELCADYHINYTILCEILNMFNYYSSYDQIGTIDYVLECIIIDTEKNKYVINHELFENEEFEIILNFYSDVSNLALEEKIDICIEYFYYTDLRDSFIQSYAMSILESLQQKNHADRYTKYLIQHCSNMLVLDVVPLSNLYGYIFDEYHDLFKNTLSLKEYSDYEYSFYEKKPYT